MAFEPDTMLCVQHGATGTAGRPHDGAGTVVFWIGSATPANAATNDLWWDTTNKIEKLFNGTTWDVSGSAAYVPAKVVVGTGVADTTAVLAAFNSMKVSGHATGMLKLVGTIALDSALTLDGGYTNPANAFTGGAGEQFTLDMTGATFVAASDLGAAVTIKGFYGPRLDVRFSGGGSRRKVTDAAISSTSNTTTLTSATAAFTSADVGKFVRIEGAGSLGEVPLCARIASRTNGTTVVLDTAASATVSGAACTIMDIGVVFDQMIDAKIECYASGLAGLAFYAKDSATFGSGVQQSTVEELKVVNCGMMAYLHNQQGDFGTFTDILDIGCTDGSVFSNCADVQWITYENYSPSSQTVGVIFDNCNNCAAATIGLGDSAASSLMKIVGGAFGVISRLYLTRTSLGAVGLDLCEVGSIDIPLVQTDLCSAGVLIRGGASTGIRINHRSQTGDTVGTKIQSGPSTTYLEMVEVDGYWNFTGSEAVRVESSVTGGLIKVKGQIDASCNQSGGSGINLVDCAAASVTLDTAGLTQLHCNQTVNSGVHHATAANLIGTDQARLGNGSNAVVSASPVVVAVASNVSIVNTSSKTDIVSATVPTTVKAGTVYHVHAAMRFNTIASPGGITFRVEHGSQDMIFISTTLTASQTMTANGPTIFMDFDVVINSVGSSAAMQADGQYQFGSGAEIDSDGGTTSNTTVAQALHLSVQMATANASNQVFVDFASITKATP